MENKKWYINPEMVVALSALLIGIVTACTSMYSAYVDRQYARASVWPRLEVFRSYSVDSFSYGVTNNGTGPAIIQYVKVHDGSKYVKMWEEIAVFKNFSQSHVGNRTLSPQGHISPVIYKGEDAAKIDKADQKITIEICYCSIYDECWVIDRRNLPASVEACTIDESERFLQ